MGWQDDGERPGLGAEGREGRIQPLAVALKRDTSGLGSRAYENRVSHFSANDAAGRGGAIVEVLVKMCVMVMFMFVPSPLTVRRRRRWSRRLRQALGPSLGLRDRRLGRRRTSQRYRARKISTRRRDMCTRNHQLLWPTRGATPVGRRLQYLVGP